jgi:hypothetical protein
MTGMSKSFTGGCACGALRFEIPSDPVSMLHCQCRHCQQTSGTGHGSYVTFNSRSSVTLDGKASEWNITGDLGTVKTRGFCPTCGSPVYMVFPAHPDIFIVHAASLDEPGRFVPQKMMFTSSAHAWDVMDPALPHFERMAG